MELKKIKELNNMSLEEIKELRKQISDYYRKIRIIENLKEQIANEEE